MSTCIWTGRGNGAWDNADNWNTNTVPVTNDAVIIPSDATRNIDAGLAQSDVDLLWFTIADGCTINIGANGKPLQIGSVGNAKWTWGGTGTYHMEVAGENSGGSITVRGSGTHYVDCYASEELADNFYLNHSGATVYLAWKPNTACRIDHIWNTAGGTLYLGTDLWDTAGLNNPDLTALGGTTTTMGGIKTLTVRNGAVVNLDGTASGLVTGNIYNGRLNIKTAAAGDTIATVNIHTDGIVDLSACRGLAQKITTVNMYGPGTFSDPDNANPTGTVFNLYGASLGSATVNWGHNRKITTAAAA